MGVLPPDHLEETRQCFCLLLIGLPEGYLTLEALVPLQTQLLKWKGWVDVEVAEHLGMPRLQLTFKILTLLVAEGLPEGFSALIAEINTLWGSTVLADATKVPFVLKCGTNVWHSQDEFDWQAPYRCCSAF